MAAKQNLRRENTHLVPSPTRYLLGRSSAISPRISDFPWLSGISSVFAKNA
ncbi:hypothetical protein [Pseudomonas sp. NFX224]|uniref:hypothetical protein n=1 Tax=Pseudomonas sp. NFX224 TaxID=3402862 RepID=UPI003AFAE624